MKYYYFSYGSNLNISHMASLCPGARIVKKVKLPGYALAFHGSFLNSYLTIVPETQGEVDGVIWQVEEKHISSLDYYEGYPALYTKVNLQIDGYACFTYIMLEKYPSNRPAKNYVESCLQGYNDQGFDPNIILKLYHENE